MTVIHNSVIWYFFNYKIGICSLNMLLTNVILSSETSSGIPQYSPNSVLSLADISSFIDISSIIVTPTQAISLGKCY